MDPEKKSELCRAQAIQRGMRTLQIQHISLDICHLSDLKIYLSSMWYIAGLG